MNNFLRGLLIGISIAAPVGPIGVLCIRRTLALGRLSGFISGLGAASADAIYGTIAGFGITFISGFLISQARWLSLIGGLFLCYLGIRTIISKPKGTGIQSDSKGLVSNFFSVFLLTLTNPLTILSFAAIFAGLGLTQGEEDYVAALMMVSGVFTGSASWWFFLSLVAGLFRESVNAKWITLINRVSGGTILAFGILALLNLINT